MLFGWFSLSNQADDTTTASTFLAMQQAAHLDNHQQQSRVLQGANYQLFVAQPDLLSAAGDRLFALAQRAERMTLAYGRIDDASELIAEFRLDDSMLASDADVLLAAYLAHGERIKQRLSGDWLVVDISAESCIVLQCHQGYSSCYYQQQGDRLWLASRLPVLLAAATRPLRPNWHEISSFMLAWHQGSENQQAYITQYADIYRVPCGQQLRFDTTGLHRERYFWPLQEIHPTPPVSQQEAVAEVDRLLTKAMRSRLNFRSRVASMLSGGFDSSTVTVYAAALKNSAQTELPTYSHVPAHPEFAVQSAHEVGNEKPLIDDVIAMTPGLAPHFVTSAQRSTFASMQQTWQILGQPIHAGINSYWLLDIFEQSTADGNGVLLSGEMGNPTTSFSGNMYQRSFAQLYRQRGLLRTIKHKIVTPYIQNPWQRLKKRLGIYPAHFFEFGYIQPELCQQLELRNRMKQLDFVQGIRITPTSSQAMMYTTLFAGDHPRGQMGAEFSEYFGFLFSDPFSYRPLQQYLLSVPNDFFFDDAGKPKAIIRLLMKDRLPASILNAQAKGRQSGDIAKRIEADFPAMAQLLAQARHSPTVHQALCLDKLTADFQLLRDTPTAQRRIYVCHAVTRAMMLIMFLMQFDETAPPQ